MNYDTCRSLNLARGCGWQEKKAEIFYFPFLIWKDTVGKSQEKQRYSIFLFSFEKTQWRKVKKSWDILFFLFFSFSFIQTPALLVSPKLHGFYNFNILPGDCIHTKNSGRWSRSRVGIVAHAWGGFKGRFQFETVFANLCSFSQSGFWICCSKFQQLEYLKRTTSLRWMNW